jgi:hypothetical protein
VWGRLHHNEYGRIAGRLSVLRRPGEYQQDPELGPGRDSGGFYSNLANVGVMRSPPPALDAGEV